jgi:phosphoenolpyruvate carboxykinase (ATP)
MVYAALAGRLDSVRTETDAVFGLAVPTAVPDVPSEVLRPRDTWPDRNAYDGQAKKLAEMFRKNFEKFGGLVSDAVKAAGPRG